MAEKENVRSAHVSFESESAGTIKIADDVIACIAGLAATEVEGVDSMAGNVTKDLIAKLGVRDLSRGVKLEIDGDEVSLALSLNIAYGYSIPAVTNQVQDKVKNAVENMTGLHVTDVSITVAGVNTSVNR